MNPENNLPLAINTEYGKEAVEKALRGDTTCLAHTLGLLGGYFRIRIWFTEPVKVYTCRYRSKTATEHIYNRFFYEEGYNGSIRLYYKFKKTGRYGYPFSHIDKIKKWELVLNDTDRFSDFEAFKKKFDLFFITETEIQKLWNSKSSQHGHQYRPSDFRKMGPRGLGVMEKFLRNFKGISNGGGAGYTKSSCGDYKILREHYSSWHHAGRDITVGHQTNCDYIYYASEYHRCGNGRYGLVANRNTFLHLEDD